jgi:hypothetical protein
MAENAPGSPRPGVVSIEENADFCAEARALVAELGLDEVAAINHAPLVRKEVAGRSVNAYDLPAVVLAELEAEPADLVFIDGPGMAGGRFSRWAVLHTVLPLLPGGFRFYLDDALSDSALEYARLWAELPRVEIAGVAMVGHGVLFGEYRPPRGRSKHESRGIWQRCPGYHRDVPARYRVRLRGRTSRCGTTTPSEPRRLRTSGSMPATRPASALRQPKLNRWASRRNRTI